MKRVTTLKLHFKVKILLSTFLKSDPNKIPSYLRYRSDGDKSHISTNSTNSTAHFRVKAKKTSCNKHLFLSHPNPRNKKAPEKLVRKTSTASSPSPYVLMSFPFTTLFFFFFSVAAKKNLTIVYHGILSMQGNLAKTSMPKVLS